MSRTERRSLAAATSSLSSPVSVSATACPTSVMFTTCFTPMPRQRKARRSVSANTYARMLPRCGNAYTVGPQLYRPATSAAGAKSSIRRPSELYSRSSWFVDTVTQTTGAGACRCACAGRGTRGRGGRVEVLHLDREQAPGPVAPDPDGLDAGAVPDQLVLVYRQHALLRGPPAAGGVTEHVAGGVGQLDDTHLPTMDRNGPPCQGSRGGTRAAHADGGDGVPVPAVGGLFLEGTDDERGHLDCADPGRQVISGHRRVQAVVLGDVACPGDVVEEERRGDLVLPVQRRVDVAGAVPGVA